VFECGAQRWELADRLPKYSMGIQPSLA